MTEQHNPVYPGQPAHHPPHAPGMPLRTGVQPPPVRPPGPPVRGGMGTAVVPPQSHPPTNDDLEPISLIEEVHPPTITHTNSSHPYAPPPAPKKIQAFGAESSHTKKRDWKRMTVKTGTGASRVRSFHGKYSEQGLEYLDNAINDWLDANPDVEIKFVTPTVMTFEGKIREPALVLNLWY